MNTDRIYALSIVNEYSKKEDSKVVQLKKLDSKVKTAPLILAISLGIVFTLILGTGMCFCMGVLIEGNIAFIIGIILGIIGIVGCSFNYFIYRKYLTFNKAKYAGDIIEIAKEIANKEDWF